MIVYIKVSVPAEFCLKLQLTGIAVGDLHTVVAGHPAGKRNFKIPLPVGYPGSELCGLIIILLIGG